MYEITEAKSTNEMKLLSVTTEEEEKQRNNGKDPQKILIFTQGRFVLT